MKTTYITLEIKHTKDLPDGYENTIAVRAYGYLYAQGVEAGVQPVGDRKPTRNPEALHVDGDDKQILFVGGSKALCN